MSQEIKSYFTLSENIKLFRVLKKQLEEVDIDDSNLVIVARDLATITKFILQDGQFFDEHCQTNIEWIGDGFTSQIRQFIESKTTDAEKAENLDGTIKDIFTSAYRFLCEAEFSTPNSLNRELSQIKNHVFQIMDYFAGNERQQLIYANYFMPADITKRLINHPNFKEIQSYNEKYQNAETLKSNWDNEIALKKKIG